MKTEFEDWQELEKLKIKTYMEKAIKDIYFHICREYSIEVKYDFKINSIYRKCGSANHCLIPGEIVYGMRTYCPQHYEEEKIKTQKLREEIEKLQEK